MACTCLHPLVERLRRGRIGLDAQAREEVHGGLTGPQLFRRAIGCEVEPIVVLTRDRIRRMADHGPDVLRSDAPLFEQ